MQESFLYNLFLSTPRIPLKTEKYFLFQNMEDISDHIQSKYSITQLPSVRNPLEDRLLFSYQKILSLLIDWPPGG